MDNLLAFLLYTCALSAVLGLGAFLCDYLDNREN